MEKLNPEFRALKLREDSEWNYSYFPILFETEEALLAAEQSLQANDILARRYFYPDLSTLPYVHQTRLLITEDVSKRVLCLPLYYGIDSKIISNISEIVNSFK